MSKFQINHHEGSGIKMQGFKMTFNNGYTISIQFGSGNYCDEGETTAEVAVWDSNGDWVRLEPNDDVRGHCSPEEVLEVMKMVESL